jgi:hypothetical protein
MANYFIIGGDGKEYGPATEVDVRQWIAEGRLNSQSRVKAESDAEFRDLAQFPEFDDAFGSAAPATIAPLRAASPSADFAERDYELDLGGCVARGWSLVTGHFGTLFVGSLLYFLIQMAIGGLSNIPFIGFLFTLANFVISGPLIAGVFYLFIRTIRGEPAEIGDIFSGFKRGFVQLFLATLVTGILVGLCMLPFLVVLFVKLLPLIHQMDPHAASNPEKQLEFLKSLLPGLISALPWLLICAVPATYLSVCWKFTLPLIIDKQVDFITAMKWSWKRVNQHWFQVFGVVLLVGLLNVAGVVVCCVGLLFTVPVGMAALMYAYETIFGDQTA